MVCGNDESSSAGSRSCPAGGATFAPPHPAGPAPHSPRRADSPVALRLPGMWKVGASLSATWTVVPRCGPGRPALHQRAGDWVAVKPGQRKDDVAAIAAVRAGLEE